MKINFSLSIKLTLIVVLLSFVVIFALTYINIEQQSSFFEKSYSETAVAFAQALDSAIDHYDELKEQDLLQNYILHFSEINPEILKVDINLPEDGILKVVVSSDEDSIGNTASSYNQQSFKQNSTINIPYHSSDTHTLTVITPIDISGQKFGTYEILISMDSTYAVFGEHMNNLIFVSFIILLFLVLSFLFLLRKIIVNPITKFKNAIKKIGGGNLNTQINIKSRDEFGDLSLAFNQMTNDLEKFRSENKEYNEKLERLIIQKDEFITQLGHDLRSPLNPLLNLIPLIKTEDTESNNRLEIINRNVDYMKNLVSKTLDLARLNSPKLEFSIDNTNLLDELNKTITQNKLLFKENNFKIDNKVNEHIIVKADKLQLAELFNNLFTNAVKYGNNGNGNIIIDAKDDGHFVTVSVKDSGIGLTQEQIEHIFFEFYKVDESRHDFMSTGLGLPICKRIVEKHGGKIWVESLGENKGSTFYFTIPTGSKISSENISDKVDEVLNNILKEDREKKLLEF
jgi:signal transduction histidine kinase